MADVLPMFFVLAAGLCLSLCLLALWNSLRNVLSPGEAMFVTRSARNVPREALLHEKNELLGTLRELRSEHELGKISDVDYQELDQRYRSRAREVLRELDEELEPLRAHARAMIEKAIGTPPGVAATAAVAAVPTAIAKAERISCSACSTVNDPDAVFCKKCGKPCRDASDAAATPEART